MMQRLVRSRAHPGYLGSQDTFYVGTLKGVGRIYQQTFVETYSKVAFAKLYMTKTPITAADLLNDRVLPFFERHELPMLRILTDRGTEYDHQLYLAVNDIDHTKTKVRSPPQTNGICERFHKTILDEFYKVTFRKKLYADMESLQQDLDDGCCTTMSNGHIKERCAAAARRWPPWKT